MLSVVRATRACRSEEEKSEAGVGTELEQFKSVS